MDVDDRFSEPTVLERAFHRNKFCSDGVARAALVAGRSTPPDLVERGDKARGDDNMLGRAIMLHQVGQLQAAAKIYMALIKVRTRVLAIIFPAFRNSGVKREPTFYYTRALFCARSYCALEQRSTG